MSMTKKGGGDTFPHGGERKIPQCHKPEAPQASHSKGTVHDTPTQNAMSSSYQYDIYYRIDSV